MSRYKYTLAESLRVPLALLPGNAPAFQNRWLRIEPHSEPEQPAFLEVSTGFSWDGCSVVPDLTGTYRAACVHDAVYEFAEDIADANQMTVGAVLRWADSVFLAMMLQDGAGAFVAYLYYAGVMLFGYTYHKLARAIRFTAGRTMHA